ncbi:hypothetical protein TIFTF001_015154 [Ficus carica]|uniref:DUF1421 domain-containing protein n=1 Tax=Ficus carica TaxID=3494 RepID=A0AA88AL35_FICCA|nr:hypothetical protein TIFTF001_015154 [Ficus carica]
MKSSDFMDKRIAELSRSHSDDFSDLSYSRGREPEEDEDLSYELSKDDLSSSFHFRPIRPVVSPNSYDFTFQNRSSMDYIDHPKAGSEKVGSSSDGGLISMIDRKMEEHSKNLLHVIDGLSVRMCQLENRTRKIEDTVDELKDSSEFNHGRTEGKLKQLENILTEIQGGIQDLREKHEISEVQLQLTKLQILKSQEKSQDQKTKTNSRSSGQGVVSSIPPQSNQSQPTPVIYPQQIPPNPNVSPNPSFHSPPPIPIAGQFPPPVSQNQIPSIPQAEPNSIPHMLSSESAHQHYRMPPIQQPQPTSSTLYQQYQPVPQLPPTSQLQYLPLPHPSRDARDPQAHYSSPHNHEEASYVSSQNYNASIQRTSNIPGLAPPSQQTYFGSNPRVYDQPSGGSEFRTEHMQPSRHSSFRDGYPHSGPPSQYISSKMKSSDVPLFSPVLPGENRSSQLPTAQLLPRALPMASDVDSGSGSSGTGKIVPVDDVVDNIVAMGFRRDIVRATVKKMAENGQSVDLNVVLDKLMNGGEVQQGSPRFGW